MASSIFAMKMSLIHVSEIVSNEHKQYYIIDIEIS